MERFSERVQQLLSDRYLHPGESPDEMFDRVSFSIATGPKEYREFKKMIGNLDFMPSTPILLNAGTNLPSLFACFYLQIPDSIEGIMNAAKTSARIFKMGGGLGMDVSLIRQKGSLVRSTNTIASGPVSFLYIFNSVAEVVKQGSRRAAMLASLSAEHPDILDFIHAKNLKINGGDESHLKNFNLSVAFTNDFMDAIMSNNGAQYKKVMDDIVSSIWTSGEPGIIFIDRHNEKWPLASKDPITGVNACGEISMTDSESCCLGAINLANIVKKDDIDWNKLDHIVYWGTKFLDNVISTSSFPTIEIESKTKEYRKIGLGTMGLHNLLVSLGLQYDSQEGRDIAKVVYKRINDKAIEASEEFAKYQGPFPAYTNDLGFRNPRRNVTVTSAQPSGTTSMIASGTGVVSSGVEPFFANHYMKRVVGGEEAHIPDWVHCALDISPEDHIKMMEVVQEHVGSSVSKTVNCPEETTEQDIKNMIIRAYTGGTCKSLTIYRTNSRNIQILENIKKGECRSGSCSL
jgi:ribonucleoside-diphosphate reductase alpha chain